MGEARLWAPLTSNVRPHFMVGLSSYTLDRDSIKLDAYRLICLFYANKEIARRSDPTNEFPDSAARLEKAFFPREMSRLLLSIAIGLRTLDDQMRNLRADASERVKYIAARDRANRLQCMMFDEMPLREVCNKIVHATVVEPHTREGVEPHEYDLLAWEASDDDASIGWEHLSGNIRLGGKKAGEQWWHLLEVPIFVEAVYKQLSDEA